jgi:hypothetical protein
MIKIKIFMEIIFKLIKLNYKKCYLYFKSYVHNNNIFFIFINFDYLIMCFYMNLFHLS